MNNKFLYSYEGVESLSNYSSAEELESYRKEALKFFLPMSRFIEEIAGESLIDVVDVGSGNSALLYNLASKGILKSGIAIEISSSRSQFAEKWKSSKGYMRIKNINSDFRAVELPKESVDFFVCNGTMHLLAAIDKNLPHALIEKAYDSLRPGGYLILDIPTHRAKIENMSDGEYSFLISLPETNPFVTALYEMSTTDVAGVINSSSKYFDKKGLCVKRKRDVFYSYTKSEVCNLLRNCGFNEFDIHRSVSKDFYDEVKSDLMLVVARKNEQ
jgi:SAM-dependent methyltransferase